MKCDKNRPKILLNLRKLNHFSLEKYLVFQAFQFSKVSIVVHVYIYILQQFMVVTISRSGLVVEQMRYNLESAQYL